MAAPQRTEPANLPPDPGFVDTTLRQVVRVSSGGGSMRVRLSNAFGTAPLCLSAVHVARSGGGGTIVPGSDRRLTFRRKSSTTMAPGTQVVSDALRVRLAALSDVVVTLHLRTSTDAITGHPGSRCTSYLAPGQQVSAVALVGVVPVDHWYFLTGIDVVADANAAALVVLGDSITDGRGSPTNGNGRWTDFLARRLLADRATAHVAVLNAGIGGNCVVSGGLGPPALERLDWDVLAQSGARWLVVFAGINDLGTRSATARQLIDAYGQIAVRARSKGLRVYGATLLPCGGSFYDTPELEAARQSVNAWIRATGAFDAVLDFEQVLRDPQSPTRLSRAAESPDGLHPANRGYQVLADSIDLRLFGR
jgi:lysophospholipase L1-like esterase